MTSEPWSDDVLCVANGGIGEHPMRKLASVRRISAVETIPGADYIESITVDGWNCIAKKGRFQIGDLCIYFEIDSFLPICPEFEFLRKSSYCKMGDKEGFRLRTIKLKGVFSQGLVLHVDDIRPKHDVDNAVPHPFEEGYDLTDLLYVTLFEKPIPAQLEGKVKGYFPSFIQKTDQERIQNIWGKIQYTDETFEVTVKLDGTSCTYFYNDGEFGVCSRNLQILETDENTQWNIAQRHNIAMKMASYGKNIALQGEIIGEGIQKNHEGLKGQKFYLFDIYDIDNQCYLTPEGRKEINDFNFCLQHVPVLKVCQTLEEFRSIKDILEFANGESLNNPQREGVVFKSNETRLTFKVISNQYLLSEE